MGQTQRRTACFKDIMAGKCCFSQRSSLYNRLHGDPVWWGKNYADWEKSQSHDFHLCVIMEMSVREKGTSAHLHSSVESQPSWKHATSWARNSSWESCEIQMKKKDPSEKNKHPQIGWLDGQSEKVSWELDQTKHTCNLAWMTAWKGHTEFPCKLGSCRSHMGFALPSFFFP